MATPVEPVRYEFGPAEDDGLVFGLSVAQAAVIVAALLVVITASRANVPLWLLVPVAAPVVAFGALRWRGERLTTLSVRWVGWLLRPRRGTHDVLAATATAGEQGESVAAPAISAPAWAGKLGLVEVPYGPDGQLVGVWDDGDACATVLAVRAPATALRDLEEQSSMLAGWGDILASAGVEGSPVQRIAWLARTAPDQGSDAAAWLRDHAATVQPSIWRSYTEVGESAGTSAASRELLVVVRVQPDRARHRLRGLRGEDRRAAGAALAIEETERIGTRLEELGCQLRGLYTPEAVAAVVRTTMDPTVRGDLAWWAAGGRDGDGPAEPGVNPASGMWPLNFEEATDHVRTDGGFHRVAWVEEWPTVPVLATWMHPLLLRSSCIRTVTLVMEPIATWTAVRATRRARAAAASEAEVRQRHGFVSSARAERSLDSAVQREQELIDGHTDMRFAGYVLVSARSLVELEEAWATTVYDAARARLRLRPLHGEHWPALAAVLPAGRMV